MKTIEIEVPEGKKAEWVNGVLTLVDEQSVEFKFKVGDKVKIKGVNQVQTVTLIALYNGTPVYKTDGNSTLTEEQIELYTEPKDITERIKTFEDACEWCTENGHHDLRNEYDCIVTDTLILDEASKDLVAYLKLRIITTALNEGWEPKFDGEEKRCYGWYFAEDGSFIYKKTNSYRTGTSTDSSSKLVFKSEALAEYAATQFRNIYMDFCTKERSEI